MPPFLQAIARLVPLTYLADALRQVMVGGAPFAPLWVVRGGAGRLAGRLLRIAVAQVPLAVAPASRPLRDDAGLPALLVDDVVEAAPAARLRRPLRSAGSAG